MIKFLNTRKEYELLINNGLMKDIEEVLKSGCFLFGPKSKLLEEKLSEYMNSNALLVGSGTDAIYLSLRALGINKDCKVVVPAISALPTAAAVKLTGAQIEYIDVDRRTGLMDYKQLRKANHLSAVVVVHLYGNVSEELSLIKQMCSERNIPLVEDCAQSFGSLYDKKKVGTIGDIGAFSFYSTKLLGSAGDGGMVVSNSVFLIEKVRQLRFYGQVDKYVMGEQFGINSRMDEIQATILLKKMDYLESLDLRRMELLTKYNEVFKDFCIKWNIGCMPHLYPLLVENRKKFMRLMSERGIETLIHYPFTLPASDKLIQEYSEADYIAKHIVSIPFNAWLTDEEVDYILENTKECLEAK